MEEYSKPKIAVLMATYNGLPWISEQVKSILDQIEVEIILFISDDTSTDEMQTPNVVLLNQTKRFGSAGQNFFRLIIDVDYSSFDYIAFADQDDIWHSNKLISHTHLLDKHQVDGVSSNVIATWSDGKKKLVVKSQPQKKLDFIFESAGPGCTFLMTPWLVNKVREQLIDENSPAREVALHDWLVYAICRAHGHKWVIDFEPSVRYRQHQSNVIGANVGLKAKWTRLKKIRQGWYRSEVVKITQVCMRITPNIKNSKLLALLNSKNAFSRLKLLAYVPNARRSMFDRCLLAISIILGLF
jgi:rhamnosyltransferase